MRDRINNNSWCQSNRLFRSLLKLTAVTQTFLTAGVVAHSRLTDREAGIWIPLPWLRTVRRCRLPPGSIPLGRQSGRFAELDLQGVFDITDDRFEDIRCGDEADHVVVFDHEREFVALVLQLVDGVANAHVAR